MKMNARLAPTIVTKMLTAPILMEHILVSARQDTQGMGSIVQV